MTEEELIALVELLNRCPMTGAEKQFVKGLITRLGEQFLADLTSQGTQENPGQPQS